MKTSQRLPFWHFFQEIEKALSYERCVDKYKLLLEAIMKGHVCYDDDWTQLKQFIKFLYLQDRKDKKQFEYLLDNAIINEKAALEAYIKKHIVAEAELRKEPVVKTVEKKENAAITEANDLQPKTSKKIADAVEQMEEPTEGEGKRVKYYHPPAHVVEHSNEDMLQLSKQTGGYLQTDEYFPVTRRQMIKGWQYLRRKEKRPGMGEIDTAATVTQIARDGLFLKPKYLPALQNRPDTVIIFADCRGSMAPFHELTSRLLHTAWGEGGHPQAPVFYFRNYPLGYVYRHPSLDQQVKLTEALVTANRNFTMAVVISDGGAARGNTEPARIKTRLAHTNDFLEALNAHCAHTIWLNPMPVHRWRYTAAELIRQEKKLLMAPLMERDSLDFQNTIRTIIKQSYKYLYQ